MSDEFSINWEKRLKCLCAYIAFLMDENNNVLDEPGYFNGNESDFESNFVLEAAVEGIYIAIPATWGIDEYEYPTHVNILFQVASELRYRCKDWKDLNSDLVKLIVYSCRYFAQIESITEEPEHQFMEHLPWHRIIR